VWLCVVWLCVALCVALFADTKVFADTYCWHLHVCCTDSMH
jgi:hypothetical protein